MDFAELDTEIHFLIRLPEYLKELQQGMALVEEEIHCASMQVVGHGELIPVAQSVENQAIAQANMKGIYVNRVNYAIARGRRLVDAINNLNVKDKQKILDYYISGEVSDLGVIVWKL